MNLNLLNPEVQDFISENLKSDSSKLALKGIPFSNVTIKEVIEQLQSKIKCEKKLPTWFSTEKIYYPNKLNIEQTSSETAALYKANLIKGKTLIDLTGGFGVDCYFFSKTLDNVTHCEIDSNISNIAKHNFKTLNANTIKCINQNGIEYLNEQNQNYDWIYIDPSRRDDKKHKVFLLSDCGPNIIKHQDALLNYSKNIMIKTSPLLDISATLKELKYVKALHILAIENEVKELLWIVENNSETDIKINTVNITKHNTEHFSYLLPAEQEISIKYSEPLTYLYEPNAAVLKSGGFNIVGASCNCNKIHKHSHLYTSNQLVEFPGRRFKIEHVLPYNKKSLQKNNIAKANITTRNFPVSVNEIRKKFKIKDGGDLYLFFTTDLDNKKVILITKKV